MANPFGFTKDPETRGAGSNGGDFTPIVKYNAVAGRMLRIDRQQDSSGNYVNAQIDITNSFKAAVDFDNVEFGWMHFMPGQAPSMALAKVGERQPPQPTPQHKEGVRFMVKLTRECGGDRPVRELAGNSDRFVIGVGVVYSQYLAERVRNPGKVPVIALVGTTPVTTGGKQQSTNFTPEFRLIGWVPRPADLVTVSKAQSAQQAPPLPAEKTTTPPWENQPGQATGFDFAAASGNGAVPSTGGTRAAPPSPQGISADDFG